MVTHDCSRGSLVHHPAHDLDGLDLLRPAVDVIADEHRGAQGIGVPPRAVARCVAKPPKQRLQLSGLPVNVSDDLVSHLVLLVSCIGLLSEYT